MSNVFTNARALSAHELTRLAASVDGTFTFPSTAGGAVTPSSGLTVAVSAISANTVTINGTLETTAYAGGTVTATTADATNPRRDLVYYDTSGAVGIAAGTPVAVSSTTGPVPPALADTQIAVAELYIAAQATTIASGDIADRRQGGAPVGMTLVANVATPTSTTSTSAVDLVTISGLSILVTQGMFITFNFRKTAAAAQTVSFGLKFNSTVAIEAAAGAGIALSSATQQAENGACQVWITPRSTADYLAGMNSLYSSYPSPAAGSRAAGVVNQGSLTGNFPNATITSVIIRAINNTSSNAAEVDSVQVWTLG